MQTVEQLQQHRCACKEHSLTPCVPVVSCPLLLLGHTRNLLDSYYLGRVIGAGSFGVVREGIKVATGKRFAVKTVSKVPKRGAPTPRYGRGPVCPAPVDRLASAGEAKRHAEKPVAAGGRQVAGWWCKELPTAQRPSC